MTAEQQFADLLAGHAANPELAGLVRYCELLERWSRVHNLVRFRSRCELVERHLLDALAGRDLLAEEGQMLDVGSGAGLPGIPLLVVRPRWRGVLLEPRQKRWAFLRLVVRELGLDATVLAVRYQEYRPKPGRFDAIMSRALGQERALANWARQLLTADGQMLLWTTESKLPLLQGLAGWRVLSSPLPSLASGRLVQMRPCFT